MYNVMYFLRDILYFCRLSGIIHVLHEAIKVLINVDISDDKIGMPTTEISQEEVQMSIALTEYFQAQRQAYDKVCLLWSSRL